MPKPSRRLRTVLAVLTCATCAALAGCGGEPAASPGGGSALAGGELVGSITVSAAASLTAAFTEIGADFSQDHPNAEVEFNFDSSSRLATQILEGAPADVFAAADEASMATLVDGGAVDGAPVVFAHNELAIITKPDNPLGIASVADLPSAGVVSLCGVAVPCGRYATEVLEAAGVIVPEEAVTRGQNAAATLSAVADGDAVAGIVYATDAAAVGDRVELVRIPARQNVVARYPIAVLAAAGDPDIARAFTDHVLSPAGLIVLEDHGFLPSG